MKTNREWLHRTFFFTGIAMAAIGFLLSRSLLSSALILLIANGFLFVPFKQQWQAFKKEPLLWGLSLFFLIPFCSGLWSSDAGEWWLRCQLKLPLLLLPFAFASGASIKKKHLIFFMTAWILLMFAGSGWSMIQYYNNLDLLHNLYYQSKVIPTLADNDHIRFSIGIVIAILFAIKLEEWNVFANKVWMWLTRLGIAWFIIFMHITGVKTGLLGIYIAVFPLLTLYAWKTGYKTIVAAVVAAAILLPVLAYRLLPTFKARVHYVMYDSHLWKQNEFTGTQSDGNRVLSIRSGWHTWNTDFFTGVGYGDIRAQTNQWFETNAPQVPASNRFLPLNQWLMMGAGAGVAAVVVFTIVLLLPFLSATWRKNKPALFFLLFMTLVFLYESTLEDQRGVFIYTFFTLWWYLTNRIEN